jgi:hypothetical protein
MGEIVKKIDGQERANPQKVRDTIWGGGFNLRNGYKT